MLKRTLPNFALLAALVAGGCGDDAREPSEPQTTDPVDASSSADAGADAPSADVVPSEDVAPPVDVAALWGDFAPAAAPVPRLTEKQLENAIHDVFGEGIVVPPIAQSDLVEGGFITVGVGVDTISPRAADDLERASREIGRQVVAEENPSRPALCEGAAIDDRGCHARTLQAYGDLLWRRPMTGAEVDRISRVSANAAGVLGDFHEGLAYGIAALIQSPNFLFRRELGVEDPARGVRVFTGYEMASRLSFLLWNTTPDATLLAAAAAGELTTDEGIAAQTARLLADERSKEGILEFFIEWYELDELFHLTKDPTVFLQVDDQLGASAREETLRTIEAIVFDEEGDFRELLTSNRTFLNRQLAALYNVPAPSREGFAEAFLPPDGGRRGLLGQSSVLMLHSHPVSSSATLRGLFVRENLLCMPVGAPPAEVDTYIPEPSGTTLTLRDRVAEHLEGDTCRGCHLQMDQIGLALENFDGVGRWRLLDNGAMIDPTGDLDGEPFDDAWQLAELVASHPRFHYCTVQNWMRFATGTIEQLDQLPGVRALAATFAEGEYRILDLVEAFVLSPAFRTAGPIDVTNPAEPGAGAGEEGSE